MLVMIVQVKLLKLEKLLLDDYRVLMFSFGDAKDKPLAESELRFKIGTQPGFNKDKESC